MVIAIRDRAIDSQIMREISNLYKLIMKSILHSVLNGPIKTIDKYEEKLQNSKEY